MAYRYPIDTPDLPDVITTGEATMSRRLAVGTTVLNASGRLRLSFFTAQKSATITQVRTDTSAGAGQTTATLCRIGVWTVDSSDNLTALVASTVNDTTLWAAAAVYTRSFSASFSKVRGQRCAVGCLVVGATTVVMLGGIGGTASESAINPRISGFVDSQADLPSTVATGSVSNSASALYAALLP
ncbi:MAG: hypothetical protein QOF66_6086 [Mycobacterium sp.]|jgi:hypothetical protein|uniref:hypothetical protein n=1 Tax=Mycobacterium sp. TaxID=1785 RepID=UPI0028BAC6B0|nr:hypothetical protein [Mycobacterium sp.]